MPFLLGVNNLDAYEPPMKKLLISALLVVTGSLLFTSCTSVPQDNPNRTSVSSTSNTYSK